MDKPVNNPQAKFKKFKKKTESHTKTAAAAAAAAAAKSLQLCLTLCDTIDGSPPSSPIPGILQAKHWSGLPFPSPHTKTS